MVNFEIAWEGFRCALQVASCQMQGTALGYQIAEQHIYIERGGRMQNPDEREQFSALLDAARRGEFGAVLVYEISFFGHNGKQAITALTALEIRIETVIGTSDRGGRP
jgi:DNA invertase Pin-like site-specific DNA recombinase